MFQTLRTRIAAGAVLAIGSVLLVACSESDRRSVTLSENSSDEAGATVLHAPDQSAAAMKVFLDPVTGEVRDPTDAEQQSIKSQNNGSRSMREQKLRKRGTAMTLEGNTETPLRACANADGSLVVDHQCNQQQPRD